MIKNRPLIKLSILLFLLCFAFGLLLAKDKPLWNDEFYTQVASVHSLSYFQILSLRNNSVEGNICPLFYLIQKAICDVTFYSTPKPWIDGHWGHVDKRSQIILRINPSLFMSLSIVLIFFYFSRYYSLWAGVYSFFLSISSFMVMTYWTEARPYALWVFLTTCQSLLFLYVGREGKKSQRGWKYLAVTHILLSLTVVFSAIQIAIVTLLLWISWDRDWKKYIFLFLIPIAFCSFFYMHSPRLLYWFADGPIALISASISKERFLIFFIFMIVTLVSLIRSMGKGTSLRDGLIDNDPDVKESRKYFVLMSLMVGSYFVVLLLFKWLESPIKQGFQVSNRYFISLTPIGIIATTLVSIYFVRSSSNKYARGGVIFGLTLLLFIRCLRALGFI